MTTSGWLNSSTDSNGIDKTRGTFTIEAGDLPVSKRIFDLEIPAHLSNVYISCFL